MTRPFSALALVAVLSWARAGHADGIASVPPGTCVRVTSSSGDTGTVDIVQGSLIRLAPGTLGVIDEVRGAIVAVTDASVIRVQTSPGPRRHRRTGSSEARCTAAWARSSAISCGPRSGAKHQWAASSWRWVSSAGAAGPPSPCRSEPRATSGLPWRASDAVGSRGANAARGVCGSAARARRPRARVGSLGPWAGPWPSCSR